MINVVKSIIKKDDKYLLIKRSLDSKFFPSLWDFPGGKIEQDETAVDAVIRETLEETSLDIIPDKIVNEFDFTAKEKSVHAFVFSVKDFSGKVTLSKDHSDVIWISRDELFDYEVTPVVRMFFQ